MRTLKLVISPKATRYDPAMLDRFAAELGDTYRVTAYRLQGPGDYRNAVAPGDDLVAVAGGDGTIREVASLLLGDPRPLGIVPVGTANVIATSLGLRTVADAAARLRRGQTIPWSVFDANGEPFLLCLGAGVDAEACRVVAPALKARARKLAYVEAFGRSLRSYPFPELTVSGAAAGTFTQLFLLTCGYYAGNFHLGHSDPTDRVVELLGLRGGAIRVLTGLTRTYLTHRGTGNAVYRPVDLAGGALTLTSAGRVPYQIDGDFSGYLPVAVRHRGFVNLIT